MIVMCKERLSFHFRREYFLVAILHSVFFLKKTSGAGSLDVQGFFFVCLFVIIITNILLGSPIHNNDFQRGPKDTSVMNSLILEISKVNQFGNIN